MSTSSVVEVGLISFVFTSQMDQLLMIMGMKQWWKNSWNGKNQADRLNPAPETTCQAHTKHVLASS